MSTFETSSRSTRWRVGVFTLLGLILIGAVSVYVNDRPYWWRSCQPVNINVSDATGLKTKSPVRSLGLEIGYLRSVDLSETHVTLGICITAPVEVLPSTRAYIRGEGFLGDKFVELKPVKYIGRKRDPGLHDPSNETKEETPAPVSWILKALIADAVAQERDTVPRRAGKSREIPVGEQSQDVQQLVTRVDELVNEMSGLTNNLKQAINPEELRKTMLQLNRTLENASRTLSPEGGLNQTAQRTLAKLEDSIEQLRDLMTRVNKGEGSVGMLLNDPSYAEEIKEAIRNVNKLLSKVGGIRFVVDVGAAQINAYNGARGWFQLGIWPRPDRYYLLGIAMDPRGLRTLTTTTTVAGGITSTVETTQLNPTGILLTGMLGKVFFNRIDLAIGVIYGDGALSFGGRLGPNGNEDMLRVDNYIYSRGAGASIDDRLAVSFRPIQNLYLRAGVDGFRKLDGKVPYYFGAGISFDDEDIKLLFAFK